MQINPFLSPCRKLKSKWIKDLHIRPDTLKLIEKKLGKTLEDMGTGEKFLNRTPIVYALRSRIDKWDLKYLLLVFLFCSLDILDISPLSDIGLVKIRWVPVLSF